MINSSVKNLGEVEYDNQNCLKHQKNSVRRKIRSEVYVLLLLYINRSITKKFPIETIRERTYSSIKNIGKVEKYEQNWLPHYVAKLCPGGSSGFLVLSHDSQLMAKHGFLDIIGKFKCHIRLLQGFLH